MNKAALLIYVGENRKFLYQLHPLKDENRLELGF
jgi:hypothetical protein